MAASMDFRARGILAEVRSWQEIERRGGIRVQVQQGRKTWFHGKSILLAWKLKPI
jgi:hypothetical protein